MQTTIHITQGQNIIKLLFDDFASCLVVKEALSVNWPDCEGSVGEYYAISDYPSEDRHRLTNALNDELSQGSEAQIITSLRPFLTLFSNGEYRIGFLTLRLGKSWFHKQTDVIYPDDTPKDEKFSGWFFPTDHGTSNYFYTIPTQALIPQRIEYYIALIKQGSRPKILVYDVQNLDSGEVSASFILDGHHKLEAYLSLKMEVPAVFIHQKVTGQNATGELLKLAHPMLKDHEFRHLFVHNDENTSSIDFVADDLLTGLLDELLISGKGLSVGIVELFIQKANSSNERDKAWLNDRLEKLAKNEFIGKGLHLSYKGFDDKGNHLYWFSMEIKSRKGLNRWIKNLRKELV